MLYDKTDNSYPFINFPPLELGEIMIKMYDIQGIIEKPANFEVIYYITNFGRIFSYIKNKLYIKELVEDKDGYYFTQLYNKNYRVNRLVMYYFGGPIPNNYKELVVNHKDSNRKNNKIDNLEWATYQENTIHGFITGSHKRDMSEEKILKISDDLMTGKYTMPQLAKKYNVSIEQINHVKQGRFHYIKRDMNYPKRTLLTNGQIIEIYNLAKSGISDKDIANKYNCSTMTVKGIRLKKEKLYKTLLKNEEQIFRKRWE